MNDMMILVEPLIPALRRYARSLVQGRDGADDLVQDCLERIVSRWHQRRADGNTRTWAFTILHNLAVNTMRQRARRGPHVTVDTVDEAMLAQGPAQEDRLRQQDIQHALARLADDQRAVLLLISVEDLTYAQAAQVLDIPIGTVMSRLARGRANLLRIMEDEAVPVRTATLRRVK